MMQRPFFSILGGMGTLATESFIRLLNTRVNAHSDQEYLDYVVFNDASVPDRTAYLLSLQSDNAHNCATATQPVTCRYNTPTPLTVLADDIAKATTIGSSFIVLTCNTAHALFDDLQALTTVPMLHMPKLAVQQLQSLYGHTQALRVGFMGTNGSLYSGVYQRAIEEVGYTFVRPNKKLQQDIHTIIYSDVKELHQPNYAHYEHVLSTMLDPQNMYRCDVVLLGCTELSLLHELYPTEQYPIVDAQDVLANVTIERALALRNS